MSSESNSEQVIKHSLWYKKIPTLLTICNSICGFAAILHTLTAYEKALVGNSLNNKTFSSVAFVNNLPSILAVSAWLILFAMIFDALDGWAARKLNATSLHGMQMDSLADMVTFGVAPAVVVAVNAHARAFEFHDEGTIYLWVWFSLFIYIGCAALRLALYNVHAMEDKKSEGFSGLPSPGAAAAICSIFILGNHPDNLIPPEAMTWILGVFLPIYAGVLGVLMNSTIPYPHMGKWLFSAKNRNRKLVVLSVLGIFMFFDPKLTCAVTITAYVIGGPLKLIIKKLTGKSLPEDDIYEEDEDLPQPTGK